MLTDKQLESLDEELEENWRRPDLPARDQAGERVPVDAQEPPCQSVYSKRLGEFEASRCPNYRRLGTAHQVQESPANDAAGSDDAAYPDGVEQAYVTIVGLDADAWETEFGAGVRRLAAEVLIHICGDSCHKYSGPKMTQICRHGFYYVVKVDCADWQRRRRCKTLRNAIYIVEQDKFGMKGRLLLFQNQPFECQSNYAALVAMRCNFDMQDSRRVLPKATWEECLGQPLPHGGDCPQYGYMNHYEWDGENWVNRRPDDENSLGDVPVGWSGERPSVGVAEDLVVLPSVLL
jgi:hypothetical protein